MRSLGVKSEKGIHMECSEAGSRSFEWLVSGATDNMPPELRQHCLSCSYCSNLIRHYEKGFRQLATGRRTEPDAGFYDAVVSAMQGSGSRRIIRPPFRPALFYGRVVVAVAASVIMGVLIGSNLINPLLQPGIERSNLVVAEGNGSGNDYAGDLQPGKDYALILENYLSENENVENDVTE